MNSLPFRTCLVALLALIAVFLPELAIAAQDGAGASPLAGAPQPTRADYPAIGGLSARTVAWGLAQMHLFLAAFVLSVPLFAILTEFMGVVTRDSRYDAMAREFMKITMAAYSLTALVGGALTIALFLFYPHLMGYMLKVFRGQTLIYALLFGLESITLYVYFYSWDALRHGNRKWMHMSIGLLLNTVGLTLMFVANAWVSFMMSPAGVDAAGAITGSVWEATRNPLWNPLNLHRFLANIAYGGAIVGGYAAYMFLAEKRAEVKAHYDWMGYTSNFIAILGFLPLPFAGYWLMAEIYSYSQQMGITAMGGILAWLFIIQAVLIGTIIMAANYYLWSGLMRTDRGAEYAKYVKYIAVVLVGGFLVWVTPNSLILTPQELQVQGGVNHRILGPLGIMPAKNTAVNLMLVFTFLSFQMFYRSSRVATVKWAKQGNSVIVALYIVGCLNIIGAGLYGYITPTVYKVGASVPQVISTLMIIVGSVVIDMFMLRGAKSEKVHWGRMSERSQYALFVLPVAFTWLMGLMGYIRSSLRTNWHVYTIMKDNSPEAYIPTIGQAGNTITAITLAFMAVMVFVFWLSRLGATKQADPEPAPEPATQRGEA
jgi:cytochrome bd ubiquinol oxidase subunit I